MTCIIGLEDHGDVYIGGDSYGVSGYDVTERRDSKVFTNGPYVMGFTSSFRMGDLLRYKLKPTTPGRAKGDALDAFMVTTFVEEVRSVLKDGGYTKVSDNKEEGGRFLVGIRGKLYAIDTDFQVGSSHAGFDSVGCGQDYALGAMAALDNEPPLERIGKAMEIVKRFNRGVGGPTNIVRTK